MFSDSTVYEIGLRFPVLIFSFLGVMFFMGLFSLSKGRPFDKRRGITLSSIYIAMYLALTLPSILLIVIVSILIVLGCREWFEASKSKPSWRIPVSVWIIFGFSTFVFLRLQTNGSALCLFAFFLVNASDSAAYVCGKIWGKTKLTPVISPGKTVEGAVGGILVVMLVALAFKWALPLKFSMLETLFYAILIGICAQCGDLAASWSKRRLGIKDFGTILPGHGGILDRFDSSLLVMPVFVLVY